MKIGQGRELKPLWEVIATMLIYAWRVFVKGVITRESFEELNEAGIKQIRERK